nr:ribosome biogenesis protein BRX1 homolog [Ipomoea batatas]
MGKKRKHSEEIAADANKDESVQERPKRTLLGWKDKGEPEKESDSVGVFRNKEKISASDAEFGVAIATLFLSNGVMCRKGKDLYLWMAKCPNGPSVRFLVNAVHTMEELKLTGNHLKGSRPILTFSSNFDKDPHWKLLKEMILQIFGTPKDQRKSKPYHDHVFAFSIVDDHIWFRNYQISCPHSGAQKLDRGDLEKMTLIEVGPRFCLNPIKIFGGSFGGPTLYENPFYVSPNQVRSLEKKQKAGKYAKKVKAKTRRKMHQMSNPMELDEFADMWKD